MVPQLTFRPLSPELMDDFGTILRGNFGAGCWCMFPRLTQAETRALPGEGSVSRRRACWHTMAMSPWAGLPLRHATS